MRRRIECEGKESKLWVKVPLTSTWSIGFTQERPGGVVEESRRERWGWVGVGNEIRLLQFNRVRDYWGICFYRFPIVYRLTNLVLRFSKENEK